MSHSNEFWNFGNADRSEDTPKGYFTPLFPHNLGRPLHHPEQDYNAHLISQIVKGFRVIGSGTDGVMTTDDLELGIKLHEVNPADADYLHYIACGCKDEEWIWVPAEMGGTATSPLNVGAIATDGNVCNNTLPSISAYGQGGAGQPYEYSLQASNAVNPGNITDWSPVGQFSTFNGFPLVVNQTYFVYVKDALNSFAISSAVAVAEIVPLTVDLQVISDVTQPNGNDGIIEATVSGGIGGYNYVLYEGNDPLNPGNEVDSIGIVVNTTVQFPSDPSDPTKLISAGDYIIQVTDSATGCIATDIVTVNQPANLTFTPIIRNATCWDFNHGTDSFAENGFEFSGVVGGTGPYEYSITDPNTTGYTWVTDTVFDVGAGDITIYPAVKDATGFIYELPGGVIFYNPAPYTFSVTGNDADCSTGFGSIVFSSMAGGPVINHWPTVLWQVSIDGGTSWLPLHPNATSQTTFTYPMVSPGQYDSCVIRRVYNDGINGWIEACPSGVESVTIGDAPTVSFNISTVDDTLCGTGGTGEFNITDILIGGQDASLDYSVSWDDGNNSFGPETGTTNAIDITNINAGTYTVTVTDNVAGCSYSESVTIAELSSSLTLQITADDICPSSITNQVGYNFQGGSGTVNIYNTVDYVNDPTNATPLITSSNVSEIGTFASSYGTGTHSFTAVDGTACEIVATVTIGEIIQQVNVISQVEPVCGADGSIEIDVTNTTGEFYQLVLIGSGAGSPQSSGSFNGLDGGDYQIIITGGDLCDPITHSFSLTTAITPVVTTLSTDITCNGANDGSATINISGGVPDYAIIITAPNGSTQTYNGTSPFVIPNALIPGQYDINGDDINGCTFSDSFNIAEPDEFIVDSLQLIYGACWNPGSNSGVQIALSGGTLDYSVAIFDATNDTQIGPAQTGVGLTSFTFMDGNTYILPTGSYYLIATDANGCTVESINFVIPPCQNAVTFDSVVNSTILCHAGNGTITATVSGGDGNYDFSTDGITWDGPYAGDPYTYTFSGTYIGGTTHTLYVRDADDLTAPVDMVSYTMADPDEITITTNPSIPESVSGAADGAISFSDIIGGTQPYATLALFDSTQTQIDIVNLPVSSTTYTFDNLEAGTYYIIITDDNGCESDKKYSIVADGSAPLTFSSSLGVISCFGGTTDVDVTVFGGSGTFRFSNDNGSTWTNYLNQTTYTFSGMAAGSHIIIVEDQQSYPGNPMSDAINLNQPPLLNTQSGSTNETIVGEEDGTITLQVSGGTPDYSATIYGADGFTDTITGTPGQTLFQWNNLVAQGYTYITEDSNSCSAGSNITIAGGTPQINATVVAGTILCPNGTTDVTMTTTDGSGDYQYGINPTGSASNPPSNWTATTQDTTYVWTSGAGSLYYWVKDAVTGTEIWKNTTITDPDSIDVSYNGAETYPGANDASIQIFIDGGTPTYTAKCIETNELLTNLQDEAPGVPSGTFTTITSAGIYTIEITDDNGCQKTSTLTVTTIFTNISIDSVTSTPTCYGEADGIISFTASGGYGSTYEWSKDGGNTWTQDITFFDGLTGADYDIFLRDYSTGETLEWSSNPVTVVEADEIQVITSTMTNGTCNAFPEYYIKFSGSNLTSDIAANQSVQLTWVGGSPIGNIINIASLGNNEFEGSISFDSFFAPENNNGTFNVKITSDGCEKTHGPISYTSLDDIVLTVTPVSEPECPGDGWVYNVSATGGGTSSYNLMSSPAGATDYITGWDGAATDITVDETVSGTTALLAQHTDYASNGCQSNVAVVNSTTIVAMSVSGSVNNPLCASSGGSTYSFVITGGLPGGTTNNTYKYKISTDGGTSYSGTEYDYTGAVGPVGISNGDIYIKAYRIANGNSTEDSSCDVEQGIGTVTNPIALSGSINSAGNVDPTACSGAGATGGVISMTITGGTGSYEFSYDGGNNYYVLTEVSSGIYEFTGLTAGTYAIVARDTNNCEAFTDTVILVAPNSPTVSSHKIEGCWRDADGASVTTTVSVANNGTQNSAGLYEFTDTTADAPTTNTTGVFTYSSSDMTTHVQAPITIREISTQCEYLMNSFPQYTAVPSLTSSGVIGNFNNTPSGNPTGTYDTDDFKVWNIGNSGNVGYGGPYTVQLIDSNGNVYGTINNATTGNNYIYDVPSGDYTYKIYDNTGLTGCGRTYTTPMTSTQQVLNEETFYHIHTGGGNVAPYGDLMSTTATWYTSAGTGTQDINTIMADMIDNGDGTTYPSGVTMPDVGTFEFAGPITGNNCGQTWTHNASSGQNYYYLTVPDNSSFSENLVTDGVFQYQCNGLTSYATARRAFTYNSENYWLYKLVPGTGTASNQYGFK